MNVKAHEPASAKPIRNLADDMDAHFYLARAMTQRHGVNVSAAMHQGLLSRADFVAMSLGCRACPGGSGQDADLHHDHSDQSTAPAWCANKTVLDCLRDLV